MPRGGMLAKKRPRHSYGITVDACLPRRHDEVLAHRLGLIPIKVDPMEFDWVQQSEDPVRPLLYKYVYPLMWLLYVHHG